MQIRLLILIAFLAFVIGVVFVTKSRKSSEGLEATETTVDPGEGDENLDQLMLRDHPLPGEEPIMVQARFRHATPVEASSDSLLGFQFMGMELTEQGRATLSRIGQILTMYDRQRRLQTH